MINNKNTTPNLKVGDWVKYDGVFSDNVYYGQIVYISHIKSFPLYVIETGDSDLIIKISHQIVKIPEKDTWEGVDGLEYQEKIRKEWDRESLIIDK